MTQVKISLLTLKPLHIIGKYLGIWPAFDLCTMEKCNFQFIYGSIALAAILIQYGCCVYGKLTIEHDLDITVFVVLIISDLTITLCNLSAIIGINFMHANELHKFLQNMQHLESILKCVKKDESGHNRNFYVELVIAHIIYVLYIIYDAWEWYYTLGWEISKFTFARDIQGYHVFVTTLLLRNYVLLIKYKLQAINYVLENHNVDNLCAVISTNSSASAGANGKPISCTSHQLSWDLEGISTIYTKLSNVINQFNDIFGWIFVFLHLNGIANMLLPLNLMIVYGNGHETLLGKYFDYNLVILCFIWFLMPLVNALATISACDRTRKEANKMPGICYNLIMNNKDEEYIKKLKDLAMQGHLQAPEFNSAGFFNCNYTLIFPTMGTLISYLIVLIQFRTSN